MPQYEKHFTVQEARECLPELRRTFKRIRELYEQLQELRGEHDRAQNLVRANGHHPKPTGFEAHLAELQELVQKINAAGIEVKDVARGLVDFPHLRDGEEVLLCWELEEPDIAFWHRIEDGYAGREPL